MGLLFFSLVSEDAKLRYGIGGLSYIWIAFPAAFCFPVPARNAAISASFLPPLFGASCFVKVSRLDDMGEGYDLPRGLLTLLSRTTLDLLVGEGSLTMDICLQALCQVLSDGLNTE